MDCIIIASPVFCLLKLKGLDLMPEVTVKRKYREKSTPLRRGYVEVSNIVHTLSFSDDSTYLQTDEGSLPISSFLFTGLAVIHQQQLRAAIFVKDEWVSNRTGPILWLPPEHRPHCTAVQRGMLGFGYMSGKVMIMELAL
jgi:hypothetical protein